MAMDKEKEGKVFEQNEAPRKRMHTDDGNTIFVKGLPNDYDEEFIKGIFWCKERIKDVRIIEKNGVKKNYCYVEMESKEDAEE